MKKIFPSAAENRNRAAQSVAIHVNDLVLPLHSLAYSLQIQGNNMLSYSRISTPFMEPENLIPCSQDPATGP
jgi:hypothetical protein